MKSDPETPASQALPGAADPEMGLTEHLAELRRRLLWCIAALTAAFCLCYAFIDPIFTLLSQPLEAVLPPGTTLIFTSYPEAFFVYIKLALVAAIFVASPVILHQIWAFVAPGLYQREKRWALPFIFLASLFFIGGGLFGYLVVFPTAFAFLASYSNASLELLPNVSEYFTLTIRLLLGFGIAFELPILMTLLGLVGVVNATMLRKNRKYAILIIFIAAAILTPTPDVVNQTLLALPLLVLYELSIFLVWLVARKRGRETSGDSED